MDSVIITCFPRKGLSVVGPITKLEWDQWTNFMTGATKCRYVGRGVYFLKEKDEHWMLQATKESLNAISKTNDVRYAG